MYCSIDLKFMLNFLSDSVISKIMTKVARKFRQSFKLLKDRINWFPGHMKSSFTHMQAKMRNIDCVIEVHDARIPFSGRNPLFLKSLLGTKPHVLVFSKKDLISELAIVKLTQKFENDNCDNVVLVNSLDQKCKGLKSIVPTVVKLLGEGPRSPTMNELNYKLMVVGIPNVGKSSLINGIRNAVLHKGKATAVGALPGVTRRVQNEVKVCLNPPIYLVDTPGILFPNISDIECGMKLALCSCIKDDIVGEIHLADFLLYWMNKTENFIYLDTFKLKEPIDEVMPLLIKIAIDGNKMKKIKNIVNNTIEMVPDLSYAANYMVSLFRKGKLGDLNFDKDYL